MQVAGNSWAITNDGQFFHKESEDWKKLNIENSVPAIWGMGFNNSLVIAGKTEVHYGRLYIPMLTLREPIMAAGEINICVSESFVSDIFVSSPSEIAVFNCSNDSWTVIPLKNHLSIPVVTAG